MSPNWGNQDGKWLRRARTVEIESAELTQRIIFLRQQNHTVRNASDSREAETPCTVYKDESVRGSMIGDGPKGKEIHQPTQKSEEAADA